jgi:hypothetical protein
MALTLPNLRTEILKAMTMKINWVLMPSRERDTCQLTLEICRLDRQNKC